MKRMLSLILCGIFVLTLCACSLIRSQEEETTAAVVTTEPTIPAPTEPAVNKVLNAYRDVLLGEAPFIESYSGVPLTYDPENNRIIDDFGFTTTPTRFCLLDLDGDGNEELILWLRAGEDNYAGYWVLRYQGGDVWGYSVTYRGIEQLKADGTFQYSDGWWNYGIGRASFENCTWRIITATGYNASFDETGTITEEHYLVDGKDATQAGVQAAYKAQEEKDNATWLSFTDENLTRSGIAILDSVPEETPQSVSQSKMVDILAGFDVFYDRTSEEWVTLGEFLSSYSDAMGIPLEYSHVTAVDFDGDGIEEIALLLSIPDGGPTETLVLHQQYKGVHGQLYDYRYLYQLKADGSFRYWGDTSNEETSRLSFGDEWHYAPQDPQGFEEKPDARWLRYPVSDFDKLWKPLPAEPASLPEVLSGTGEFFSRDSEDYLTLEGYLEQFAQRRGNPVSFTRIAAVDLDGNGVKEAVLKITIGQDNEYGTLVLREHQGQVQGESFSYRQLSDLKTNGTFCVSGSEYDGPARLDFDFSLPSWKIVWVMDQDFDQKENVSWEDFSYGDYHELLN